MKEAQYREVQRQQNVTHMPVMWIPFDLRALLGSTGIKSADASYYAAVCNVFMDYPLVILV